MPRTMKLLIGNLIAMLLGGSYLLLWHKDKLGVINDIVLLGDILFVMALSLFFGPFWVIGKEIIWPKISNKNPEVR